MEMYKLYCFENVLFGVEANLGICQLKTAMAFLNSPGSLALYLSISLSAIPSCPRPLSCVIPGLCGRVSFKNTKSRAFFNRTMLLLMLFLLYQGDLPSILCRHNHCHQRQKANDGLSQPGKCMQRLLAEWGKNILFHVV